MLLLLGSAIATLQWWAPYALPSIARLFGLNIEAVQYVGDGTLRIQKTSYHSESISLQIETMDILTPAWWFWWGWRDLLEKRTVLHVHSWELKISPPENTEPTTETEPDLPAYIKIATDWWQIGRRWVPHVSLEKGTLQIQDNTFQVPSLKKTGEQLEGLAIWQNPNIHLLFPKPLSLQFSLIAHDKAPYLVVHWTLPEISTTGSIEWIPDQQKHSVQAHGSIETDNGNINLTASWIRGSWLPESAEAEVKSLTLQPSRIFPNTPQGEMVVSASIQWLQEAYQLQASFINKEPVLLPYPKQAIHKLSGIISASGDTNHLQLDTLAMTSDGIVLELDSPVRIRFSPFLPENQTRLKLFVDLSKQQWIEATGTLSSNIEITSANSEGFTGNFSVMGESLLLNSWPVKSVDLSGSFNQDSITLRPSILEIVAENRISLSSGGYSWQEQKISSLKLNVVVDSQLRDILMPHLSADFPKWDTMRIEWQADGALAELQYDGMMQWKRVFLPEFPEMDGHLAFSGTGTQQFQWDASLQTDNQFTLSTTGTLLQKANRIYSDDWQIVLKDNEQNQLSLHSDLIEFSTPSTFDTVSPSKALLKMDDLQLQFTQEQQNKGLLRINAEVHPDSLHKGSLQLTGWLEPITWLSPLAQIIPDLSPYFIEQIKADLRWDEGPLLGMLTWNFGYQTPEQETWVTSGSLEWTTDQLIADSVVVGLRIPESPDQTHTLVQARAQLPLSIFPANRDSPIYWREQETWELAINSSLDESSLIPYTHHWPISIHSPQLDVSIGGTPYAPSGSILFSAPRLLLRQDLHEGIPPPQIRDLRLQIQITPEELLLHQSGLQLEDRPLQMEARLPWQEGDLLRWIQQKSQPDLSPLSGKLSIAQLQLEPLEELLPEIIRAQGELTIQLEKQANQSPTGKLQLSGMGTLPLGPLGSLDNIQASIQLDENGAILENGWVLIGGMPVTLDGNARFQDSDIPLFLLRIKGENIPFVRSAGLILRADLDVVMEHEEQKKPVIKGSLLLRDSILLTDLTQFSPSPQSPEQRPPFFSVDIEPFNNWDLDVEITGNRFLTIRNPVLDGRLSTQMTLIGTLQEPQIIGNASLHNARVKFPFARFNVSQGTVSLDRTNPYDPRLSIQGSTESLGYNLQMNLSGTASNPELTFSSTPPLSSAQILLLVTAGQPPSGEVNRSATGRLGTLGLYLGSGILGDSGNDDSVFSRISVESGQRVSEQGKETMQIQYRLNDRWYLIGEYDEFDAYNMDIKWKIFSK